MWARESIKLFENVLFFQCLFSYYSKAIFNTFKKHATTSFIARALLSLSSQQLSWAILEITRWGTCVNHFNWDTWADEWIGIYYSALAADCYCALPWAHAATKEQMWQSERPHISDDCLKIWNKLPSMLTVKRVWVTGLKILRKTLLKVNRMMTLD